MQAAVSLLAFLMTVGAVAPASAQQGAVADRFYNRPGATPRDLTTALAQCRAIATGLHGTAVEGPRLQLQEGALAPREPASMTIEDCMVARGWRLYALTPREAKARAAMTIEARDREHRALTGAACPQRGRLLRRERGLLLRDPARDGPECPARAR